MKIKIKQGKTQREREKSPKKFSNDPCPFFYSKNLVKIFYFLVVLSNEIM
jgi:hypothetical protein